MHKNFVLGLLAVSVLASACQAQPTPTVNQPSMQVIRVDITPSTSWLIPAMDACVQDTPGINLTVREISTDEIDPSTADILIMSGVPAGNQSSAVELGKISVSLIVHPTNSLETISYDLLAAIIGGQLRLWSEADPSLPENEIQVWLPTPGDEIYKALEHSIFSEKSPSGYAHIAPVADAMLSVVSMDPNAIGFLPEPYLNPTVKAIDIQTDFKMPIIAVTPNEPKGKTRDFLLCLQSAIQSP
jgi:DNA-binding transcriptional LysR family regulator